MKEIFESYPELLMVDATYRLNNLKMPLYVMVVEDGNGGSEIAAIFFVVSEGEETIRQMMKISKRRIKTKAKWLQ